jgi:hypothetical protein
MTLLSQTFTRENGTSSPPRTLAGFSHPILGREPDAPLLPQTFAGFSYPILGREPDAHFLTWMMPPRRRELAGFSHPILSREPDAHFLMWMMPPGFLLSHYPIDPVASPRCVARSPYYFWEIRGSLRCVFPTPNILGFAAHLRSPHTGQGHPQASSSFGAFAQ